MKNNLNYKSERVRKNTIFISYVNIKTYYTYDLREPQEIIKLIHYYVFFFPIVEILLQT